MAVAISWVIDDLLPEDKINAACLTFTIAFQKNKDVAPVLCHRAPNGQRKSGCYS